MRQSIAIGSRSREKVRSTLNNGAKWIHLEEKRNAVFNASIPGALVPVQVRRRAHVSSIRNRSIIMNYAQGISILITMPYL